MDYPRRCRNRKIATSVERGAGNFGVEVLQGVSEERVHQRARRKGGQSCPAIAGRESRPKKKKKQKK